MVVEPSISDLSDRYRIDTWLLSSPRWLIIRKRISYLSKSLAGIVQVQTFPSICFTSSSVVPTSTIFPSFIIAFRVAIYSTSETMCVEISTIRSWENSEMKLRKRTRSPGSSHAVGSSITKIFGSFNMAWAMPTRRFIPPDSFAIFFRFTSESVRISSR